MYFHNSDGSIDNSVKMIQKTVTQQPQIYSPTQAPTQNDSKAPQNTPDTVEHYRKCKKQRKKKNNMMMNIVICAGIVLIAYFLIKHFSQSSAVVTVKNEIPSIISKGTNLIEPTKISDL